MRDACVVEDELKGVQAAVRASAEAHVLEPLRVRRQEVVDVEVQDIGVVLRPLHPIRSVLGARLGLWLRLKRADGQPIGVNAVRVPKLRLGLGRAGWLRHDLAEVAAVRIVGLEASP